MVDIVDNMAMMALVDSNDRVYMLEKMGQVGTKGAHLDLIGPNGPDWSQLTSTRLN